MGSKEIGTENINKDIDLGAEYDTLRIYDGLVTPVSRDTLVLSEKHRLQIEGYTLRAAQSYGDKSGIAEPTHVHNEHGIPALVVRVDCTIDERGEIIAYEMEDSPSGQGITDALHKNAGSEGVKGRIIGHYENEAGQVPHVIVSGMRSHGTDDKLIIGEENYSFGEIPENLAEDRLVIVKAIPGVAASHQPFTHLQERALAPLKTEGDKSYTERIGDVKSIAGPDELLLREDDELCSQVLKARIGSMANGVCIYLDPEDRKVFGKKGTITAAKLKHIAGEFGSRNDALVQEFNAPIRVNNPEDRPNAILRVFVLLSRGENKNTIKAEAIGGCYVARPELIVHGASNSIAGAVMID